MEPAATGPSPRLGRWYPLLVAAAALLAAALRLPGVLAGYPYLGYVDEGHLLHPVRQTLRGEAWDPAANNYPALPVYAIAAAARLAAAAADPFRGRPLLAGVEAPFSAYDVVEPPELAVVARALCLLVAVAIVLVAALAARRAGGDVAGAVAAFAAALLPALVVRGAIVAVDGFAALFALGAVAATAGVTGPGQWRRIAAAGACCGLAAVCKYPAGLAGLVVATALALAPWPWRLRLRAAALAGAAGAVAAAVAMPALVTRTGAVWERVLWQGAMYRSLEVGSYWRQAFVAGEWDVPLPYPELGAPFTLWALAGLAALAAAKATRGLGAGIAVFAAALVAVYARYDFQAFRNLLPLAALACVTAGHLAAVVAARWRRPRATALLAVALLAGLFAAPARFFVAERRALVDSRAEAVEWIAAERPGTRGVVLEEAAFAPAELARLAGRVRAIPVAGLEALAPRGPRLVVLAALDAEAGGALVPARVRARLARRYDVVAAFGEESAVAAPWAWRGSRMRVEVLERSGSPPDRGAPGPARHRWRRREEGGGGVAAGSAVRGAAGSAAGPPRIAGSARRRLIGARVSPVAPCDTGRRRVPCPPWTPHRPPRRPSSPSSSPSSRRKPTSSRWSPRSPRRSSPSTTS